MAYIRRQISFDKCINDLGERINISEDEFVVLRLSNQLVKVTSVIDVIPGKKLRTLRVLIDYLN